MRAFAGHSMPSSFRVTGEAQLLSWNKSLRGQFALGDQQRGIRLREQFGVAQLMIVGGAGKRHEEGAFARRCDLGHRRGAGAADDQIGIGKAAAACRR